MPEIEIRSGGPKDFSSLTAFEHGYYSEYVWQMSFDLSTEVAQTTFKRVRLPRRVFVSYPRNRNDIFMDYEKAEALLIAVLGDRSVGYIKVQAENNPKVARVTDLVVSAPMRQQGIASALILAVMNLATHRQFHNLVIEMQSKNDPAIKMANKLGFNFCGYRDDYFPNHDLAMFFSRFVR